MIKAILIFVGICIVVGIISGLIRGEGDPGAGMAGGFEGFGCAYETIKTFLYPIAFIGIIILLARACS